MEKLRYLHLGSEMEDAIARRDERLPLDGEQEEPVSFERPADPALGVEPRRVARGRESSSISAERTLAWCDTPEHPDGRPRDEPRVCRDAPDLTCGTSPSRGRLRWSYGPHVRHLF
ncbi:hypothetical protein GCM10007368_07240 [Isoptericola cucumis]|uniref:Uncharacterized protein n=1 Tax=Isoptericola cucumis TaxID=1776856 RepID=A0ABQ2B4K6_9MICO|nr:hypothetical protein GCM10007368_07240 [Isoptericola cucumis]